MIYVCARCQRRYSTDYAARWGTTAASNGMGPRARCTHLVPNPSAPPAERKHGDGRKTFETPLQVCGGELAFSATGTVVDDPNDALPIQLA